MSTEPAIFQATAATVGTFDGVHRGHLYLLDCLRRVACDRGLEPVVILPTVHPRAVVSGQPMTRQLSTFSQRRQLIEQAGVQVYPLQFDENMRRLTSAQFLAAMRDRLNLRCLLTGHDNRFGSDRQSAFADYVSSGERLGIEVIEAPVLPGVSSTAIRAAIEAADMSMAASMLGRPYTLAGTVVRGQGLGHTIGFATANLMPLSADLLIPPRGVYATLASIDGGDSLPAVTNIGYRPTVDTAGCRLSIETHIHGVDRNLYGEPLAVAFVARLRDERRFPSVAALTDAVRRDMRDALSLLRNHGTTQ